MHDRELNCVNLVLHIVIWRQKMATKEMKAWFAESVIIDKINPFFVKSKSPILYIESLCYM